MNSEIIWIIPNPTFNSSIYIISIIIGSLFLLVQFIDKINLNIRFSKFNNLKNKISDIKRNLDVSLIPISIIFFIIPIILYSVSSEKSSFNDYVLNSKTMTIEGIVNVENEQPKIGHASGDKITIGTTTFIYSYFYSTSFYNITISHGGILTHGANVKIQYIPTTGNEYNYFGDGKIIKIEKQI
ncbi:MAG: hypothetical protein OCD02_17225 [Spirochaetaceae bacterium]